jgi:hypothetical protein
MRKKQSPESPRLAIDGVESNHTPIESGELLLDHCHDALLLGKRWKRKLVGCDLFPAHPRPTHSLVQAVCEMHERWGIERVHQELWLEPSTRLEDEEFGRRQPPEFGRANLVEIGP